MNKQLIIKIGGIVSAIIFALGAVFPIATVEIFGSTMDVSLIDGGDWIFVVLNAIILIVTLVLSENTSLILSAITTCMLADCKLGNFFNESSEQVAPFMTKGIGFYCMLIGTALIIIFVTAYFLVGPATNDNNTTKTTKKCPFCAETIKAEAILCRFCGSKLDEATETTIEKSTSNSDEDTGWNKQPKHGGRLALSIAVLIATIALAGVVLVFGYFI